MRIGILLDNLIVNGAQMVAWNLARGLCCRGHEVAFYYYHEYPGVNTIKPSLHEQHIPCRWIRGPRLNVRRYLATIDTARTLRALSHDAIEVLNVHSWEKALSLRIAKRLPERVPIVYTHHGTMICNGDAKRNRLHLGVYNRYRYEYEKLTANRNCSSIDIGIDPDYLDRFVVPKRAARESLGMSDDVPTVLTIGRCNAHRGCDLWLETITVLADVLRCRCRHVFIGADARGQFYQELRTRATMNENIVLLPTLAHDQVIRWMCAADVLLVTSRTESFAIKALESLYCGCPVVMHFLGVLDDLIKEDINGSVVDYMDVVALARATAYWVRKGRGQKTSIPQKYHVQTMVQRYEACFENMVRGVTE